MAKRRPSILQRQGVKLTSVRGTHPPADNQSTGASFRHQARMSMHAQRLYRLPHVRRTDYDAFLHCTCCQMAFGRHGLATDVMPCMLCRWEAHAEAESAAARSRGRRRGMRGQATQSRGHQPAAQLQSSLEGGVWFTLIASGRGRCS